MSTIVLALAITASGCRKDPVPAATAGAPAAGAPEQVRFERVGRTAGVRHRWPAQPRPLTLLQAFGCGCAFLDYDADGWQDVLLIDEPHPVLYRNLGGTRFEEVTGATTLDQQRGAWKGCAVGDPNGDGLPDLLLTGYHRLALLQNDRGRRWLDVTAQAGFRRDNRNHWASGAGFMDLDGDGWQDLVLLNYVEFKPDSRRYCEPRPGLRAGCPPRFYLPEFPELWRNQGDGRFQEVTPPGGMEQTTGTAQVLAFTDVDGDGRTDFYIGNDGVPSDLMLNLGSMRFRNAGLESGVAYGSAGNAIAAMSADWADYDRDGRLDLFVTAFSQEPYSLLRSMGDGTFRHTGEAAGIADATRKPLGFGSRWLELDNDGWPDLAIANGHVYDRTAEMEAGTSFRQPLMLLRNQEGSRFQDLVPLMSADVGAPILGRGLATGDLDNDGREDLLAVDYEGEALLLHNVSATGNHWITLELQGRGPNPLAYGAQVTGRAGNRTWIGQVSPASSYLSSSDPRVHFGLGAVSRLETLTVRWPDGREQQFRDLAADRVVRITQGEAPVTFAPSGRTKGGPRR